MSGWGAAPRVALLASVVAISLLGCGLGRPATPRTVGTTFPPPAPTKVVDPAKVIAGMRTALGPGKPVRLKASADVKIDKVSIVVITDGDFQGNEMDVNVAVRNGATQLSFDVIGADGKAYVRPYGGKWIRSPEKLPPEEGGPFGDLSKADLKFAGTSRTDRDLYTIVWKNPTGLARALDGTVWTKLRLKTAAINFEVDINGKPYTATYKITGTGTAGGKRRNITVNGYYQFFVIREPLEFTSPLKK